MNKGRGKKVKGELMCGQLDTMKQESEKGKWKETRLWKCLLAEAIISLSTPSPIHPNNKFQKSER